MNELTKRPIGALMPQNLEDVQRQGNIFLKSDLFGERDLAQACVKIMAGMELGFTPIQSMTGIHIIKGKIAIGVHLMAAGIVSAGYDYKVLSHDETECEIEYFSPGGESVGTSRFTMDDAIQAGVGGKDMWKKYPKNMLYARAMSNGAKWYCAGAFGGSAVYVPEELNSPMEDVLVEDITPKTPPHVKLREFEAAQAEEREAPADSGTFEMTEADEEYVYDGLVDEKSARLSEKKEAVKQKLNGLKGESGEQLELA